MPLTAGVQLGPYRIEAAIGAGGMGEVYRAHDSRLGRDVALKTLPDGFSTNAERRVRFEREARLLAALNHSNIAQVHGFEELAGAHVLVMELVEGETLAEQIARGPIPPERAVAMAKQIAEALEAAHEQGIVHRDLKPANVKVRPDGVVKVLDFGLGTFLELPGVSSVSPSESPTMTDPATREGSILGTAAYMSPEQARGERVDARADIWALGCVLYELLTGHGAFARQSVAETLARVIEREPAWEALPASVPPGLRRLLQRCLEKDPKRRLHAAADVRIALEDAIVVEERGAPVPLARRRDGLTVASWLAAAVALALGGYALSTASRAGAPPPRLVLDVNSGPTNDAASFALSPDGRQLAFVALEQQTPTLWLRPLERSEATRLEGTEGASQPFWAPDGRSIAFFADGLLKRLELTGGRPRVLAHARNPMGGAWSRGDVIVYAPYAASPLMKVAASGGMPTGVSRLSAGEVSHRFPAFLPDGHRFLFFGMARSPAQEGVYLGSLESHDRIRLPISDGAAVYATPGYLLTVGRESQLIALPFDVERGAMSGDPIAVAPRAASREGRGAFSASASGLLAYRAGGGARSAPELVWVDRGGKVTGRLQSGAFPILAPDGRHAIFVLRSPTSISSNNLWLVDAEGHTTARFTFDDAFDVSPTWSPDGREVVFASNRNGAFDLFEKPAGFTRDERVLLQTPDNKYPVDWSPDRRDLLFVNESATTGDDLWTLSLATGIAAPFLNQSYAESQGQFSPDGKWVAYRCNESGRWEILVRRYRGSSSQRQVSRGGGIQPRWRRDGRELFYVGADGRLMAVPVRPATSDELEFGEPVPLFAARLATPGNQQFGYSVNPLGQRFLVSTIADGTVNTPITIVQNWTPGLAR